jgi:PEGA domain
MKFPAMMPLMSVSRIPSRFFRLLLAVLLLTMPALAKDAPLQVIDWPDTGTPVLRFTFSKFKQLDGASNNLKGYVLNTMVENLSPRTIPAARFSVYLFDKNKVRIGEDFITLNNVGPGESLKVEFTVTTSGTPTSVTIKDAGQNLRTVSLTVNSIPQGAVLKLDQTEMGTTPKIINVGIGKHILTFTKEGFTAGTYPLEISPQDVSGGSVSYELGTSAFDSIELRDGSVLNGDLVSISGMDVEIRVGGVIQHIDRNKIKRAMFVQRSSPLPNLPGPVPQ